MSKILTDDEYEVYLSLIALNKKLESSLEQRKLEVTDLKKKLWSVKKDRRLAQKAFDRRKKELERQLYELMGNIRVSISGAEQPLITQNISPK